MSYASKVVLVLPLSNEGLLASFVEDCLRDRVYLIAISGAGSDRIEHLIDDLIVGDGSDSDRFVVTSSHEDEPLSEVIWFAGLWSEGKPGPPDLVRL